MKNAAFFTIFVLFATLLVSGQENSKLITKDTTIVPILAKQATAKPERRWGDAGAGIGLDYGGVIGAKATVYPVKYMGVFGAVGWELIDIGWNVGILGRAIPADGKYGARPYLKIMYGVNAATKVSGKSGYDKMFYGVTVGVGLEARFGKKKKSGINLDLNVPFRSPEYFDMIDRMKNDPSVTMTNSPIPVAFSVGYLVEF